MNQEPCKKCGEYHNNCYELAELTDEEKAKENLRKLDLALKAQELTDEEWVATYTTWCLTSNDPLVLKRAILRKAQEK